MSRHQIRVILATLAVCSIAHADDAPRPILAWPSSPLETRIVFDRPPDDGLVKSFAGRRVTFQSGGRDGSLAVAGARVEPDGRTIVLATDPHPVATRYSLTIPSVQPPLVYTLAGVEASWEPADADGSMPAWTGWWPHLDTSIMTDETKRSPEHLRQRSTLATPGRLTIRATLDPGPKPVSMRLKSAISIVEVAVGGAFIEIDDNASMVETGPTDGPLIKAEIVREGQTTRVPASMFTVPWAPPPSASNDDAVPINLPGGLEGGDPARGRAVFLADESKCATCHRIGTDGREVGPDLSHPGDRDLASLYRSIAEPSARIHPAYVTFTVSTTDGRILAGIVRADGPDAIRVTDTEAKAIIVPRADVAEIQPSGTSIMPVGLAGALGPDRLRDLIAYLASLPPAPAEKPAR
jgi:putative heme-binding domain-containing protein